MACSAPDGLATVCPLAEKPEGHSQARPEDELDAQVSQPKNLAPDRNHK
jgi:hypothetical protein